MDSLSDSPGPFRGSLGFSLFKYRSLNQFTDQIFLENTLYFPRAKDLNDPYELSAPLDKGILSAAVHERIDQLLSRGEISEDERGFILYFFPLYKEEGREAARLAALDRVNKVNAESGILSLSERNDSILMWSHYADQHKGICIEFEELHERFLASRQPDLYQVRYGKSFYDMNSPDTYIYPLLEKIRSSDTINAAEIFELLREITERKARSGIYSALATKAQDWEYEKEWRMIYLGHSGKVFFAPFALKKIIFGSRVSEETIESYIHFVTKVAGKPFIRFQRARLEEMEFVLNIQDI